MYNGKSKMVSVALLTGQRKGKVPNCGENGNRKEFRYLSQECIVIPKQEIVESICKLRA